MNVDQRRASLEGLVRGKVKGYDALMELHDVNPDELLGDKGYDSDEIRNDLMDRGIEPVIPPRSNSKTPIEYDREAYKRRNLVERCVNWLKQFRRIATRYEKTADLPLDAVYRSSKALDQNCQHDLDPDIIVFGGGLSNVKYIYTDIISQIGKYTFSDVLDTTVVRVSHGDSSGVRGAAWLWPPG